MGLETLTRQEGNMAFVFVCHAAPQILYNTFVRIQDNVKAVFVHVNKIRLKIANFKGMLNQIWPFWV